MKYNLSMKRKSPYLAATAARWMAICLGLWLVSACGSRPPTYQDVVQGRIELAEAEKAALSQLCESLGLEPSELDVSGAVGANPSAWVREGQVRWVRLNQIDLNDLSLFQGFPELERIVIGDSRLPSLAGLGRATKLTWLQINRCELQDVHQLNLLTALQHLSLRENAIQTFPDNLDLPDLTSLDLAFNRLERPPQLGGCPKLESLDLSDNRLTSVETLQQLTALTTLNLARNQLENLAGLAELPQLRQLFADDNQLADTSGLDQLPALELVNLNDNQLQRFPNLVTRMETHLWSGNPGYADRLAADFETERERRTTYSLVDELPTREILTGSWSRGLCSWSGLRPRCDLTIPHLDRSGRVFVARYPLGEITTDRRKYGISGVVVQLSVEQGCARIYLQQQSRLNRETEQLESGYAMIEARPGDDKSIAGNLFNDGQGIWFLLEVPEGEASGISYRIEPGYVP